MMTMMIIIMVVSHFPEDQTTEKITISTIFLAYIKKINCKLIVTASKNFKLVSLTFQLTSAN